jgi:hypothetical protein
MVLPVARPFARLVLTTIVSSAIALGSLACGDANTGRSLGGVGGDDLGGGDGTSSGGDTSGGGGNGATTGGGGGGGGGGSTGGGGGTTTGGGNTGGGGTTAKPSFTITADKTAIDSELQMLTDVNVTLTPKDGFTGSVTLATTGLPTGATGVFTPASVNVTGTAPVTAVLRITTPSTVTPTAAPLAIKVTGSGGTGTPVTGEAALTYNVKRVITITIPQNVAQATNPFGAGDIVINTGGNISGAAPIKVIFVNKDSSKDHIVHSTNTTNGFVHGNTGNAIPLNGSDPVRNVTGTGRYPFYMHDGANTPAGAVKIN